MLNAKNFIGALSQVGVPVTRKEAEEVVAHYSVKGARAPAGREVGGTR